MFVGAMYLCVVVNREADDSPVTMKKVNKQCLLDTPRTVRVSEKNMASYSSNQQTLVLKRFQ